MPKKEYRSFSGYGVDVGQHRADDLDRKVMQCLEGKPNAKVLDLGSGALGLSKRLAISGVEVVAVDIDDFSSEIPEGLTGIRFVQADIRDLAKLDELTAMTDVVMQRTLHYLRYQEALLLLTGLHDLLKKSPTGSGKLFISVSGIDSDIGKSLLKKNQPIDERFSILTKTGQVKFSIKKPVCLYTKEEFEYLLTSAGFQVEELWISAFKNYKAVAIC